MYEVGGGEAEARGANAVTTDPAVQVEAPQLVGRGLREHPPQSLWTSAGNGVHCYAPDGTLLGKIAVPEIVANICFGGPKRNRLFICGTTALYAIYLAVRGATRPAR